MLSRFLKKLNYISKRWRNRRKEKNRGWFQYWGASLFSQEAMMLMSNAESGLAASKMCNCNWLALIARADASCLDSDCIHEPKHKHLDVNLLIALLVASKLVTSCNREMSMAVSGDN